MKSIDQALLKGKKVLVRVDYNVPQNENLEVTNRTRIERTVPTIKKITEDGGIAILMSHLGRPKGEVKDSMSLRHIIYAVSEVLGKEVHFLGDACDVDIAEKVAKLKPGDVAMLENLRFHKEEEKGDENFAQTLAQLGDIYVNDAFGTAHREHASTATIVKFFPNNAYAGYLLFQEVQSLKTVFGAGHPPFTAIIGGSKISTKIKILNNLLDKVDNLIIGGGMAYTFLAAMGVTVGSSPYEEEMIPVAREVIRQAHTKGIDLYLPIDNICGDSFSNDANTMVTQHNNIPDGWEGLDIGPRTIKKFTKIINASRTILWNGPVGVFEFDNFGKGTQALAISVASATLSGAYSLVGGGDTISAIGKYGFSPFISYISTGGGAMLEYLEGTELPGIKALEEN